MMEWFCKRKQNHDNQISEQKRQARGVGYVYKSRYLDKQYIAGPMEISMGK